MLEQEKAQGNLFFWTAISIIRMLLLSLRAFVAPVKETNYSSIVNKKLNECKLHVKLKKRLLTTAACHSEGRTLRFRLLLFRIVGKF